MKKLILITAMIAMVFVCSAPVAQASIYSCGFETSEGFAGSTAYTGDNNLNGQQGWTSTAYGTVYSEKTFRWWDGATGDQYAHFGYGALGKSAEFNTAEFGEITVTMDLRLADYGGFYWGGGGSVYLYDSNDAEITRIYFAPDGADNTAPSEGKIMVTVDGVSTDTGYDWVYDGEDIAESLEVVLNQTAKTMTISYNGTNILTDANWGAGTGNLGQIGLEGGRLSGRMTAFDNIEVEPVPELATLGMLGMGLAFILLRRLCS